MSRSPGRLPYRFVALVLGASIGCRTEVVVWHRDDGGGGADTGVVAATVSFTNETTSFAPGSELGTAFADACPDGRALVGISGDVMPDGYRLVTGVAGTCGLIVPSRDGATVDVVVEGPLPFRGDATWGDAFELACPAGHVVVGLRGRAGSAIDKLGLVCAPLSIAGGSLVVGAGAMPTTYVGGTGGSPYDAPCAAGQIARGRSGYADTVLESIALTCATPVLASPP